MKAQSAFYAFLITLLATSCLAQQPLKEVKLGVSTRVLMLDAAAAGEAINTDAVNGYFDKVTASELSIQMKKPLQPGQSAADIRAEYAEFLKTDVEDFTAAETQFVAGVMENIFKTVEAYNKDIFPAELKLLKTRGRHVGNSVYYTRENCIIIPANELENRDERQFTSVMYHELFHVYSRLNPVRQKLLYGLIGFESIGFQNLVVPQALRERVIFNPDGVDFAQKITLQTLEGKTIQAVPIIYANHLGFKIGHPEFFSYMEFNLFQVVPEGSQWRVVTTDDGISSTLDLKNLPDFFRQIRDNTHYIIHPDEVLADNFSFIMMSKTDAAVTSKFSAAGKQLLLDMETILKGGNSLTKDGRSPSNGSNR